MVPLLLLACFSGAGPADDSAPGADDTAAPEETSGDTGAPEDTSEDTGGRRCLEFEYDWVYEDWTFIIDWSHLHTNLDGEEVDPSLVSAGTLMVYERSMQELEEALCEGTQGAPIEYAIWANTFGEETAEVDVYICSGCTALVRIDGEDGTPWMYKLVSADSEQPPPPTIFVESDDAAWR